MATTQWESIDDYPYVSVYGWTNLVNGLIVNFLLTLETLSNLRVKQLSLLKKRFLSLEGSKLT